MPPRTLERYTCFNELCKKNIYSLRVSTSSMESRTLLYDVASGRQARLDFTRTLLRPLVQCDNELTRLRTNTFHCTRDSLMRRSCHHGKISGNILFGVFSISGLAGTCFPHYGPYPYEIVFILFQFDSGGRKAKTF